MTPGFRFIVDEKGRKTAVVIDLKKFGDVREDFYDTLIARQRAGEPRESLAAVKRRLQRRGKFPA
jgi:hypothetical protein